VPDSAIVIGADDALSIIVTFPDFAPCVCGENVTWIAHVAPGAAVLPYHYVFFACEHGHVDPKAPQKGWRTAWRNLTRAVTCPTCGLLQPPSDKCTAEKYATSLKDVISPIKGLRFHDLRHHAITELAESQTSDSTIMAIAGHVSQKMLAHYSHVRLQAKRPAPVCSVHKATSAGYAKD
jgi:hypothetical protein